MSLKVFGCPTLRGWGDEVLGATGWRTAFQGQGGANELTPGWRAARLRAADQGSHPAHPAAPPLVGAATLSNANHSEAEASVIWPIKTWRRIRPYRVKGLFVARRCGASFRPGPATGNVKIKLDVTNWFQALLGPAAAAPPLQNMPFAPNNATPGHCAPCTAPPATPPGTGGPSGSGVQAGDADHPSFPPCPPLPRPQADTDEGEVI